MLIKVDIKDDVDYPLLDKDVNILEKYISNSNCVADVLELSSEAQYQDVTIICNGGKCQTNSFLLASLFPIVKNIVEPSLEEKIISLPSVNQQDLSEFFSNILR